MNDATATMPEACIRAREAAEVLFADFPSDLTPHEYERCHIMRRTEPDRIRPEAAEAMLRLFQRVAGVRA
jgi:hypothetical protein